MVVHTYYITGRLPPTLEFAYCALYVCCCGITYQTIVALSANSPKQPPKCRLDVLCLPTFHFYWGFASNQKKYHFSEMKGDVRMSRHEKEGERNRKMPIPQPLITLKSLITPSLHLCLSIKLPVHIYKCSELSSYRTPITTNNRTAA